MTFFFINILPNEHDVLNNTNMIFRKLFLLYLLLPHLLLAQTKTGYQSLNGAWDFVQVEQLNHQPTSSANWRTVQVPHDWSREFAFDSINGEGCTGYLLGGIGWYKKQFELTETKGARVYLNFDGVYNNATVYLNGKKLGFHPYGYSPFTFDISSDVRKGQNEILVQVDRSRYADSRWYTGSGIYRQVNLYVANKLHFPLNPTFITTPKVSQQEALVNMEVKLNNDEARKQNFELVTQVFDPSGKEVLKRQQSQEIKARSTAIVKLGMSIDSPVLWDIHKGNLYTVKQQIIQDGKTIGEHSSRFGIRTFKFDAQTGFSINGTGHKIKGVCLHHDGGLFGAAVPKGAWRSRLQTLIDGGCNAIRISHNPASKEFLELCDEMGLLVQEEFFDEWDNPKDKRLNMNEQSVDDITRGYTEHFQEWAKKDLEALMYRDLNHPCIIQWSIGNEIEWTYPRMAQATGFFNADWSGNYFWSQPPYSIDEIQDKLHSLPKGKYDIGETAQKLARWTKAIDTTRPVIANCILPSASYEAGYADALDIVGFSYRRVMYDYGHKNYPNKPLMGTENLAQWHEWKAIMERPFVAGTFLWTGIDYLGESNNRWPQKATPSGMLNLAGFEKPSYYMMQSLWTDHPMVYMSTQALEQSIYQLDESGQVVEKKKDGWKTALWEWHQVQHHWNYHEGELVVVELISNCEEVELFLNGVSKGKQALINQQDRLFKWAIPFEAGRLKAVATHHGKQETFEIYTTSAPQKVKMVKQEVYEDQAGEFYAVTVQLVDQAGHEVYETESTLKVEAGKGLEIFGLDNGWARSTQPYQSNQVKTHNGKALLVFRKTADSDEKSISITAEGIEKHFFNL